jgi:hypothetical protein
MRSKFLLTTLGVAAQCHVMFSCEVATLLNGPPWPNSRTLGRVYANCDRFDWIRQATTLSSRYQQAVRVESSNNLPMSLKLPKDRDRPRKKPRIVSL